MAKTKLVANKEETDVSTLKISDLKKLMEEKGIEGRSKITKKADMIEIINLHNRNTDKEEIKKFIASKTKTASTPKAEQESVTDVQEEPVLKYEYEDELLKQVLILSKKIGKNIKLCAHQSLEDVAFKKKWIKELERINQDIENMYKSVS